MRDAVPCVMRTTVDLDPRVLAVARARVSQRQSKSIGAAISELALAGLEAQRRPVPHDEGLILLPTLDGHIVTDEAVEQALDE